MFNQIMFYATGGYVTACFLTAMFHLVAGVIGEVRHSAQAPPL